jgi:hypothetical protein
LLATHPDTTIGTLPDYGWLEGPTKRLHVRLEWLEIRDTPPEGSE